METWDFSKNGVFPINDSDNDDSEFRPATDNGRSA
jgi:hypothetical protein